MKTKRTNSLKKVSIMLLFTIACFVGGCNNQQKESNSTQGTSTVEQPVLNQPKVDIHTAAFMGNWEIIKEHINAGTNINATEPIGGSTPLISATVFGHTKVALELIKAGANLNIQNNEGSTALHSAAFFCRIEIVKSLLENGADKSITNIAGATALETVSGDFKKVKGIYDFFGSQLGPLGLKLDYDYIENTRPQVVQLLK